MSPPNLTRLLVLLLVAAGSAAVALWADAAARQTRLREQARALQASEPSARLAALRGLDVDGSDESAELVLRRLTDTDEYVRATAMERAYRLGLGTRLDARHLPTVMASAQDDQERTRRWALALLTAHSLDLGLGETLRAWPSLHSPYSRPFLVAVLAREAEGTADAGRLLDAMSARNATGAAMVRAIRLAQGKPPQDRYPCPFPPELKLEPERPAATHHNPSPAPTRPLPAK